MNLKSVQDKNYSSIYFKTGDDEKWFLDGSVHIKDGQHDGMFHREDGPAYINKSRKTETWYKFGRAFRLDGPAVTTPSVKTWIVNNRIHREDGPAVEYTNGNKEYYIADKKVNEEDYEFLLHQWKRKGRVAVRTYTGSDGIEITVWNDLYSTQHRTTDGDKLHCADDRPAFVSNIFLNGDTKIWYKNGKRHRDNDRPAFQSPIGVEFYKEGALHRIDNPASIMRLASGHIEQRWLEGGKFHRKDGPAYELFDVGDIPINLEDPIIKDEECLVDYAYYRNGKQLSEESFFNKEDGFSWSAVTGMLAVAGVASLISNNKKMVEIKKRQYEQVSH